MKNKSRRFLTLFALAFVFHTSFGQMKESVLRYYKFKNLAERSILDSNFPAAIKNYQHAFQYKKPSLFDAYNAFVVACILQDSLQSNDMFEDLVTHGMRKQKLEELSYFKGIKESPFYQWLTRNYDSLTHLDIKEIDRNYVAFLDNIYQRDQSARYLKIADTIIAADRKNIFELKSYIEQHGYPTFSLVGMFEKSYEGSLVYFSTLWLIMLHTRHLTTDLNATLRKALNTGDLPSEDYASFMDLQKTGGYGSFFEKQVENDKVIGLKYPSDKESINKKRAEIGLDDIAVYKAKLEYQREDHRFIFVPAYVIALQFSTMPLVGF